MSEPNVLVSFRLAADTPLRLRWLATDGTPGDGYKPQVTAIKLMDGSRLAMHTSAIIEQTAPDPGAGATAFIMTFNGMVGFDTSHPDRAIVDALVDQEIEYELDFIQDDTGKVAVENTDYRIVERPRGMARKLAKRTA
jgi:hypothetical protein